MKQTPTTLDDVHSIVMSVHTRITPTTVIRQRTPEDDESTVRIENSVAPEFPPQSVEDRRHRIATTPPEVEVDRSVAEVEGNVVGAAFTIRKFWTDSPTSYAVDIEVDPEWQHRGIGSKLYDYVLETASRFGAERLFTYVRVAPSEGMTFAEHRGFESTGRVQRMSRLDVRQANLEGYEGIDERVRAEGLRVATLAEVGPDDETFIKDLYELDLATTRDIPSSEPFTSVPFDAWLKDLRENPGFSPHTLWVALDGQKPVALAILIRQGTAVWNGYTGVAREFRGKGVARALKLRTIEWSRQNGVDYIYTGNDIDNTRMLSVNVRLGYQPLPNYVEVMKQLSR